MVDRARVLPTRRRATDSIAAIVTYGSGAGADSPMPTIPWSVCTWTIMHVTAYRAPIDHISGSVKSILTGVASIFSIFTRPRPLGIPTQISGFIIGGAPYSCLLMAGS